MAKNQVYIVEYSPKGHFGGEENQRLGEEKGKHRGEKRDKKKTKGRFSLMVQVSVMRTVLFVICFCPSIKSIKFMPISVTLSFISFRGKYCRILLLMKTIESKEKKNWQNFNKLQIIA